MANEVPPIAGPEPRSRCRMSTAQARSLSGLVLGMALLGFVVVFDLLGGGLAPDALWDGLGVWSLLVKPALFLWSLAGALLGIVSLAAGDSNGWTAARYAGIVLCVLLVLLTVCLSGPGPGLGSLARP